jgi:hypothetical protein
VGSFTARLVSDRPIYHRLLAESFGVFFSGAELDAADVDAEMVFREDDVGLASVPEIPPDALVLSASSCRPKLHTELFSVVPDPEQSPVRATLHVREPLAPEFELAVHLTVILHKLLFLMDRLILHAAAVRLADRVSLLVGEKGAGKTTSSIAVARAGGAILAEDHVLVSRVSGQFLVSGCDEHARLAEETERHYFPNPIEAPVRELGGLKKKEIRVADYFESMPYRDFGADRLCFVKIGTRFSATPIPGPSALVGLLDSTRKLQRFASGRDQGEYLGYLADFVQTVPCFQVELSPDLNKLDLLVEFLMAPGPGA